MSENIDINVGIIKEEISINAANNIIEVNISTAPVTIINPQNYDLSQFTNTSPNPFIQQSTLSSYVPISRIITINGVAQDLSTNRSWTIPGATWGSITGTLAAQTDLQAALNARVPYTGATSNVNLGEYGLTTGQLTLDTSPTGTAVVGTTRWNDSIGSSETTLKGGSVILKNGVDLVARVVNKVTPNTTLTKANYTAVRISGAQGQRLAVAYAQANSDANSADTIGLVAETIPTNQEGFIITVGNLEGINTTGSLQGESWSDGDILYLSPTIPGAITNIKPTGLTGHIVVIGYVEYAHAINGKIYVKIMNGWELDELHNVYINPATLANNNILQYDSADQLWKNKVLSTGITIGSTAIASGVVGRVLFEGAGNVVQESGNLFWDNTNGRLGIGTATPTARIHIVGTGTTSATTTFISQNSANSVNGTIYNDGTWFFGGSNTRLAALPGQFDLTTSAGNITSLGHWAMFFRPLAAGSVSLELSTNIKMLNTNVLINTTTDAGFKLDVNGTAVFRGTLSVSTGGASITGNVHTTTGYYPSGTGQNLNLYGGSSGTANCFIFNTWGSTNTVNSNTFVNISRTYDPVGGTGVYTNLLLGPTINQTGGANGITRGLYIAPTLTAAADFRAIETTAGNVIFNGGNVGIGTSSPTNILTLNRNVNATDGIFVSNSNTGALARTMLRFTNDASEIGQFSLFGSGTGVYANKTFFEATKDFVIGVDAGVASGGTSKFQVYVNGYNFATSPQFTIASTGNVLIGTTTDAGFRLDVNGTARVQGNVTTTGSFVAPSLSGSSYMIGSVNAMDYGDGLRFAYSSGSHKITFFTNSGTPRLQIPNTGNVLIGTTTDAGYKLDVNGTARATKVAIGAATSSPYQLNVWGGAMESYISLNNTNSGNATTDGFQIGLEPNGTDVYFLNRENGFIQFRTNNLDRLRIFSTGNIGINTTTDVASAQLNVESTTQGFLPPRMTTTQKNAIATPATGLMVYDTDLNRPCFYNGSSWITL